MKKILIVIVFIILFFIILPVIEIKTNNRLLSIKYKEDLSIYEDYTCYHESVSYNKRKDISITKFNINKYFIFYLYDLEYESGNLCDSEYLLEESYIKDFIENAEITYNSDNIDIEGLIEGKDAIIGNIRYTGNDYKKMITYKLNGRYEEMYVFYQEDLLIIQVGSPDESTKFIAYK